MNSEETRELAETKRRLETCHETIREQRSIIETLHMLDVPLGFLISAVKEYMRHVCPMRTHECTRWRCENCTHRHMTSTETIRKALTAVEKELKP